MIVDALISLSHSHGHSLSLASIHEGIHTGGRREVLPPSWMGVWLWLCLRLWLWLWLRLINASTINPSTIELDKTVFFRFPGCKKQRAFQNTSWIKRFFSEFELDLVSPWDQFRINLGSTWDQLGTNLGSTRGRLGVDLSCVSQPGRSQSPDLYFTATTGHLNCGGSNRTPRFGVGGRVCAAVP